jgi:hypothetical protein
MKDIISVGDGYERVQGYDVMAKQAVSFDSKGGKQMSTWQSLYSGGVASSMFRTSTTLSYFQNKNVLLVSSPAIR